MLPPANKKTVGCVISPNQLVDLLLTKQNSEYLDCFAGSSFYSQNTTRYFNLKPEDLKSTVPKEISFLASLYAG